MKNNFSLTLAHIVDDDTPIQVPQLYGLSVMNKEDLARFEIVWPELPVERRRLVMKSLMELTENNFEVSFDAVFLLGLNDADEDVCVSAIKGLWVNDSPALIPAFIHLMKQNESEKVRAAAASALGQYVYLGEIEEIDDAAFMVTEQALLETIRKKGETVEVIRRAIESISFSSSEGIEQIIESAYYHDDELMQISAIFAMGRNYNEKWGEIVIAELGNERPEMRFEATRACGELALKASVDRLIQLINTESDSEVQQSAIWSLGQIGGSTAQEVLEALLDSEDEVIAATAEDALEELNILGGDITDLFDYAMDDDFDDDDDDDDFGVDLDSDFETFRLN